MLVKLNFKSPLHIGLDTRGVYYEDSAYSIRSDQFFSAICNSYLQLFGEVKLQAFLNKLEQNSDLLKITDLFPFVKDKYYIPTPLSPPNKDKQKEQNFIITRKNRPQFICSDDFTNYINGDHDKLAKDDKLKNNIENELIITNIPHSSPKDVSEKNKNSEDYTQGEFYHYAAVVFPKNSGLWALIKCRDDDFLSEIKACIKFLGDEGIGGKKSWGYGQFDPIFSQDNPLEKIEDDNENYYLLSTLIPKDTDNIKENSENAYYELIPRRGWIYEKASHSGKLKKEIYAFASGSVFNSIIKGNTSVKVGENCIRFGNDYFIKIKAQ